MTHSEMFECLEAIKDSYKEGYNTAFNRACKWLEENLLNYWSQINANNTDDFIENFKKVMKK